MLWLKVLIAGLTGGVSFLVTLIDYVFHDKRTKRFRQLLLGLLLCIPVATILAVVVTYQDEQQRGADIAALRAQIDALHRDARKDAAQVARQSATAGSLTTPATDGGLVLRIGDGLFMVKGEMGVIFADGEIPMVTLNRRDGGLLVSAKIRDATGKLVAELVDNEWSVNRNNYYDRNYRDDLIEVMDEPGRVVLQAVALTDAVYLSGMLTCRNGAGTYFGPRPDGGWLMQFGLGLPGDTRHTPAIGPICTYPSSLHLGECPRAGEIARRPAFGVLALAGGWGLIDACSRQTINPGPNDAATPASGPLTPLKGQTLTDRPL
jgi:hypothetical protein